MSAGRKKERIDLLLAREDYFSSREKARRAVMAGLVLVDGQLVTKPGKQFSDDVNITIKAKPRYVGRGGRKLEGALEEFDIDPAGMVALDAGSSTGGFTDCLLQAGARRVYAFDVGKGQLDWNLRRDCRVIVKENFNVRYILPDEIKESPDLVTVDVSFISLKLVLGPLAGIIEKGGMILALIKPQFEAGRNQVGRGGVVKDPAVHREVIAGIESFSRKLGLKVLGVKESVLRGPAGNREFFILLIR